MGLEEPPPVGLNWGTVSQKLGLDVRVLEHDGCVALRGEYFIDAGYAIDPMTYLARFVDVADIALRHCYFVGDLTLREYRLVLPLDTTDNPPGYVVIPPPVRGAIIGLFKQPSHARRAKDKILRGGLGSGLLLAAGPLGTELRVDRPEMPGQVATAMLAQSGALISIDGVAVSELPAVGPVATSRAIVGEQADVLRPGTGSTGQSQVPAREIGGSQGVTPY